MIEHVTVPVADCSRSKAFYTKALAPLGYHINMDFADAVGFMEGGHTSFWITEKPQPQPTHVALLAPNKEAVHQFHKAALKAGGADNGEPGPRPEYSPDYYAAFVLDFDGNNIEAVWYDPNAA